MEKTKLKTQKSDLTTFLEGYKKANELIKAEKITYLSQLTHEKSLQEYDSLCNIWEKIPRKDGLEMLERQRVSFLIERRKRFNKIGGFREK